MGYNTAAFFLNDAIDALVSDPDAGKKIYEAIMNGYRHDSVTDFNIGSNYNAGSVVQSKHANDVQIVAVGGNRMRLLGTAWNGWRQMDDTVALLRELADREGYRLVKKPVKP